eukprot:5545924-Prymnesium_polylepis.1
MHDLEHTPVGERHEERDADCVAIRHRVVLATLDDARAEVPQREVDPARRALLGRPVGAVDRCKARVGEVRRQALREQN